MSSELFEQPGGAEAEAKTLVSSRRTFTRRTGVLAVGVLVAACGVVALLMWTRPRVSPKPPEFLPPLVRVLPVTVEPTQFWVRAQGTVEPKTESNLAAEVSGRIGEISPALVEGGFFAEGDVLARIEPSDYRVDVDRLRASLELRQAESELAERNLSRRSALAERGVASTADLDNSESQLRVAKAAEAQARAQLARAELDLRRTDLIAPFSGRVRKVHVDLGDFVDRGTPIALLYGTDVVEIRLPVPDQNLGHLAISLGYGGHHEGEATIEVRLRGRVAGSDAEWTGTVDRVEGEIDRRSRMVAVVAQVKDPYGIEIPGKAPLAPGMFVEAEIEGRRIEDAVRLPREALREGDQVLVLEDGERLRLRDVVVARLERDEVVISAGLATGDSVCVSALDAFTDGMRVRVAETGEVAVPDPETRG